MIVFSAKNSSFILKTLIILEKRLILNAWLGPGCASADWWITVIKIKTKIGKYRKLVKMESL